MPIAIMAKYDAWVAAIFVGLAFGDLLDRRGMFAAISLTHTCYATSFHASAFLS